MPKKSSEHLRDQEELVRRIMQTLPRDGSVEPHPGLFLIRLSSPNDPIHSVLQPSFCIIAQGAKQVLVGKDRIHYDSEHFLVTTMGLPAVVQVVEASQKHPYLSMRVALDPGMVTSMMIDAGITVPRGDGSVVKGLGVSPLDPELLNAALRLARLIDNPAEYRVLAPLFIREIIYRLLIGKQAKRMCHLATFSGPAHRMSKAVELVTHKFNKPLRVEMIAKELGMSASSFHSHFKAATAMSPMQFQKQLRLQEARRLILSENLDAGEAGYRVGYVDQSHFSRAYRKQFGEPPMRDMERLREISSSEK